MNDPFPFLAANEADKYDKVWAEPAYSAFSPGYDAVPVAMKALGIPKRTSSVSARFVSIADFGCGRGVAAERMGLEYRTFPIGVDISQVATRGAPIPVILAPLWATPGFTVNCGFCCDVMEHIPPSMVHDVLKNIAMRVEGSVYFQIALFEDHFGPALLGQPLHLTVMPARWWMEQLVAYWSEVHHVSMGEIKGGESYVGFVVSQPRR